MALIIKNEAHHQNMIAHADLTGSRKSLDEMLTYLDGYGCHTDPDAQRVELGYDMGVGYGVTWYRRKPDGTYVHYMYGGLVYHQMSNEWSVHT